LPGHEIASFLSRRRPAAAGFARINIFSGFGFTGTIRDASAGDFKAAAEEYRGRKKMIITLLVGLIASVLGTGAASAASPAYCAFYAKEVTKNAAMDSAAGASIEHFHDRAYSKCLNMDDEPLLPDAYADSEGDGAGGPFVEETAVFEPDPPRAKLGRTTKTWQGSGFAAWSPEWTKWCAEHFPNSFDPESGTIIPYKTGVRTMCR